MELAVLWSWRRKLVLLCLSLTQTEPGALGRPVHPPSTQVLGRGGSAGAPLGCPVWLQSLVSMEPESKFCLFWKVSLSPCPLEKNWFMLLTFLPPTWIIREPWKRLPGLALNFQMKKPSTQSAFNDGIAPKL